MGSPTVITTKLRPRHPPLPVAVVRPGSVVAEMHPSHAVPVVQPVDPASLLSDQPGNALHVAADGGLFVGASSGGGTFHEHIQGVASSEWTIFHGLGKHPSVDVFDSAGDQVEGDVRHMDENQLLILFSSPFAGVAYLN